MASLMENRFYFFTNAPDPNEKSQMNNKQICTFHQCVLYEHRTRILMRENQLFGRSPFDTFLFVLLEITGRTPLRISYN